MDLSMDFLKDLVTKKISSGIKRPAEYIKSKLLKKIRKGFKPPASKGE